MGSAVGSGIGTGVLGCECNEADDGTREDPMDDQGVTGMVDATSGGCKGLLQLIQSETEQKK